MLLNVTYPIISIHGGVSRQNVGRKMKCWMQRQHLVLWCGPCSTQRQTWGLIFGPHLATKTWLLSFNRTQSGVVTGLMTGHNTPKRHLHLKGLSDSSLCRRCGAEDETSAHILCELWNFGFTQTCVSGLLFLGARGHQECKSVGHLELSKVTGLPQIDMGHKGPVN